MDLEGKKFHTQRELLEYLGKNSSDNKLVGRLINKGWVYVEGGIYHYIGKVDVKDLIKEIKNLKENIGSNTEQGTNATQDNTAEHSKAENTLIAELNSNLEYVNDLYIKMEASREASIRKCYNYMVAKKVFNPEVNPFESFFKWATM